jgi:hypothetical protein
MGGFRSKPDLQKHTITKEGFGLSYAVSHMCGQLIITQAGDNICRMDTLQLFCQTKKRIFLPF